MLRIGKADYDLIRWEAERSYPHESCGIIFGTLAEGERRVTLTVPAENTGGSGYTVPPEQLVAALKLARNRSETILGFYHSYPDRLSNSSSSDLTEPHWIGCSYVITSVERGHASITDAYMLIGSGGQKKFQREEIEVLGDAKPLGIAL